MSKIGHADVATSGGFDLIGQSSIFALSLGFGVDDLPGHSSVQYSVPASMRLRLVVDDEEYYAGGRMAYVRATGGSDTSITGGELGFIAGFQWGSGDLAYGLLFAWSKIYYTRACVADKCAGVAMEGVASSTIRLTVAW
jgi:hypothetical protein